MEDNNYNFMRLWNIAEQPYSAAWTTSPWYTDRLPTCGRMAPSEMPLMANPSSTLIHSIKIISTASRTVIEAGEHGIYVDVMLFEGWSLGPVTGSTNSWTYHPFNKNNNINGIPRGSVEYRKAAMEYRRRVSPLPC